jgi:hypothetical protein
MEWLDDGYQLTTKSSNANYTIDGMDEGYKLTIEFNSGWSSSLVQGVVEIIELHLSSEEE